MRLAAFGAWNFKEQGEFGMTYRFDPDPTGSANPHGPSAAHGSPMAWTPGAVQLARCNVGIRDTGANRRRFADSVAVVLEGYPLAYYGSPIPS